MQLERGITIAVLPRFRHTLLTPAGIRLNSGVECLADQFAARNDWQCPNDKELAVLVGSEFDAPEEPTKRIELFEIPGHLYKQWGEAADELAAAPGQPSQRYERFVRSLASFFTYKNMSVENSTFNVIAAQPPEEALGRPGSPAGLRIGDGSPLLTINLGEEPTSLIFLNLPIERMSEFNNFRGGIEHSERHIAERFMVLFPYYPVVRLILPPRQGVRFFPHAVVHDGYTVDKKEIDVVLQVSTHADKSRAR